MTRKHGLAAHILHGLYAAKTNDEKSSNAQITRRPKPRTSFRHSGFVIRSSFDIRHSADARSRSSPLQFRKGLIRFFQRLFASDVEPFAFDLESFHGLARVKPLHKAAWLIGIISRGEVRCHQRDDFA